MVAENPITILEREIDDLFATARQALRDIQVRVHGLVNEIDVAEPIDSVLNHAKALEKAREKQRAKKRSDCDDCLAARGEVALIQSSHVRMRPYCDCCEKLVEANHICSCEEGG